MKRVVVIILVLAFALVVFLEEQGGESESPSVSYRVESEELRVAYELVRVIDGDTIQVRYGGEVASVRMIGLDAPETKYSERGEECFAEESSAGLRDLLVGDTVLLQFDDTQGRFDVYDRLLAYVFLPNGIHAGEYMIQNGYAEEYTFKGKAYLYQDDFRAAEQLAAETDAGLWGVCKN